jgi:hypothetical protein
VEAAGYSSHWTEVDAHAPVHGVRATPGSLAERALNGRAKVNSIHHQAVAEAGPHLVPTAWADDDLVEAVEAADGRPLLGVQWHPERMACPPEGVAPDLDHLAAFEWLMAAAGGAGDALARPLAAANGHANGHADGHAGVGGETAVGRRAWGG